jgi:hypothetical protein
MKSPFLCSLFLVVPWLCVSYVLEGQTPPAANIPPNTPNSGGSSADIPTPLAKLPSEVILVRAASPSASDSVTPVPEAATVAHEVFSDPYFGITYALPQDWTQEFEGPPPSASGRYVLAQIGPPQKKDGPSSASMLITAQDMFFTPMPASNALELSEYLKDHLQPDYKVERAPTVLKIAGRSFSFFAYWSPVAELHWHVLGVQIRCHALQFVLTSRDTELLDRLMLDLNRIELPTEASATTEDGGGPFPVCIKDYARDENIIARVDPVFTERRFNPVPVRIIIDRQGKVKDIHLISAFPDQAKAITDALEQWRFKPYVIDGKPAEVETGILFGRNPHATASHRTGTAAH